MEEVEGEGEEEEEEEEEQEEQEEVKGEEEGDDEGEQGRCLLSSWWHFHGSSFWAMRDGSPVGRAPHCAVAQERREKLQPWICVAVSQRANARALY